MGRTLAQKVWDEHVVRQADGEPDLLYIDLHLIHEVTSPQAFDGLRLAGRQVRRPDLTLATEDHNVPTIDWDKPIADPVSRTQVETMRRNAAEFGVRLHPLGDIDQGIVHVVGPQLGLTQPGMTIVCGDSHTSTHGAFGALAFGIGTTEVGHVLATQCLLQTKAKTLAINVTGKLKPGITAKDLVLAIIGKIGVGGGTGHVIEFRGEAIRALSMDERMTVCNMSIEAGARAGMVAPDETTFAYLKGRPRAPQGADWERAVADWRTLVTDEGATFDREVTIDANTVEPMISWGTHPGMVAAVSGSVPASSNDPVFDKALSYMGFSAGQKLAGSPINVVFVGSCTNSRLSDLRAAASVLKGRKIARGVQMLVVPGSQQIKKQAEAEGLDRVFIEAGAEWRESGCSMCLGMNGDTVGKGLYSVSTSNRNFEGRQGVGARTLLASPLTAAASALRGKITDPRELL